MTDVHDPDLEPAEPRDLPLDELDRIDQQNRGPTANGQHAHTPKVPDAATATRACLGALLINTAAVDHALAAGLRPEHLHRPADQLIYSAILTEHAAGRATDTAAVTATLEAHGQLDQAGGPKRIFDLGQDAGPTTSVPTYATQIIAAWRARRLIALGHELTRTVDPDQALTALHDTATQLAGATNIRDRALPGDAILDAPEQVPAIWGTDNQILQAEGESLFVVGPTGVGKTTLIGQQAKGVLGLGDGQLLGFDLAETPGRVLYIAMDRPEQIIRALRRTFDPADRQTLAERLTLWKGPPPFNLVKDPAALAAFARTYDATHIFIDSLKDLAVGLNDDAVGSAVNIALQTCLADGIAVTLNHHQKKGQGEKPRTIEHVYGSSLITNGAGSIVLLWGAAGDLVLDLEHLKQPVETVGPLKVAHDHDTGTTTIHRGFDPVAALRGASNGRTTADLARLAYERNDPTENDLKKMSRRLRGLQARGKPITYRPGTSGGAGGSTPGRWYLTTPDQRTG